MNALTPRWLDCHISECTRIRKQDPIAAQPSRQQPSIISLAGSKFRLLGLAMILSFLSNSLTADQSGDFTFSSDGFAITITGYTGPGGNVTIPDKIDGLPVTNIGYRAFQSRISLTSVTIPDSVTSIKHWAFLSCTSLASVTISKSISRIEYQTFAYCTSLTSLTIPEGVTSIGSESFRECTSLTSVTIPNSVTSIGYETFRDCGSLTGVTIPNSVTSIGDGVFRFCTSLTEIEVDPLNSTFSSLDGVLFNKAQTNLFLFPAGKGGSYMIPNSVVSITGNAFESCIYLTDVTISGNITTIEPAPFRQCTSLTSIVVDQHNASYSSLEGVLFNKNQTTIFAFPPGLVGYYAIPNSVTSIGDGAFSSCIYLNSVTIPISVNSIGEGAFYECSGLTSVSIPRSVTNIADYAFSFCRSLISATFLGDAPVMGSNVFYISANVFTVNYYTGKAGFTSPSWMDYQTVDLGPFRDPNQGVADAIEQPEATIIHGGQAPWFGHLEITHDGGDAALSGDISNNQSSTFSLNASGPGTVSFWWKVSSEKGFDYLSFYIDGQKQTGEISGDLGWQQESYFLTAGSHTLRWNYSKDDSASQGYDCGWVDQVVLPDLVPTPRQKFDTWAASAGLTGIDALPNASPYHDGVCNSLKYAFKMNASGPDVRMLTPGTGTAGLPVPTFWQNGLQRYARCEYLRRKGSGLIYTPQESFNLVDWFPLSATPVVTSIDAEWERVVIDEPYDPTIIPHGFGRVEVSIP